ncbi:MAG: FIST N-terminal domain-containing protein [Myxococcota bacterium]
MPTIVATASSSGTAAQAVASTTTEIKKQLQGQAPCLVMAFASTSQPLGEVLHGLKQAFPGATVLGSSTAGEFTQAADAKGSTAVFALAGEFQVFAGMGTSLQADVEGAVGSALKGLPASVPGFPHRTGILLLDPLSGTGEEATLLVGAALGEDVPLAGGAAGDDLHMKACQVGLDGRAATDAVVAAVLFSKTRLGLGVCHGHRALSAPMKVTRAEGNVVHEVEGRPAWEVWKDATRDAARKANQDPASLKPDQEGAFLLRYEAALETGSELKVRAPLSRTPAGAISFACAIPEGATIRITESEPARQVESAREAARRAHDQLKGAPIAGALVFDCICRNLILGSQFHDAVKSISTELGNVPLAGYETYGEIALSAGDLSGFHNTTTVVLAFPR